MGEYQTVTLKMEPLDQSLSIDAHKLNHTAKVITRVRDNSKTRVCEYFHISQRNNVYWNNGKLCQNLPGKQRLHNFQKQYEGYNGNTACKYLYKNPSFLYNSSR